MLTQEQRKIVKKARDLIADPTRWCQGSYARNRVGLQCNFDDPSARSFCALGAIAFEYLASSCDAAGALDTARSLSRLLSPSKTLHNINDEPEGLAKVLDIFDKALAE